MKGPVRDVIDKADWAAKYGERAKYPSIQRALEAMGGFGEPPERSSLSSGNSV